MIHPPPARTRPLSRAAFAASVALAIALGACAAARQTPVGVAPSMATSATSSARAPSPATMRAVAYPVRTMGTLARVVIMTADSAGADPIARRVHAAFARVDSLMSNWTTTSEVARINGTAGAGATPVQPEVAHVIDAALRIGRESDGAFDITVEPLVRLWGFLGGTPHVPDPAAAESIRVRIGPGQVRFDPARRTIAFAHPDVKIDLGGIAKGHAVDEAVVPLRAAGIADALVDVSGNMFALGHPEGAPAWRIGIRDPRDRMPYFARLRLSNEAVATSGTYEQFVAADGRTYGHIMDPRRGRPAEGLISVTVVTANAMDADAWGTALFVLGPEAARRTAAARSDVAAILVQEGRGGVDTVWVEKSLEHRFTLERDAAALFQVRTFE